MKFALLSIKVLLVTSVPALAQVNTLANDKPREEAAMRVGPFYVTPRIQVSEVGVDTNVFNEAGQPRRDFTATLSPGATVWFPVARRGLIKADADTDLVWYRELASERSIDPSVRVRGEAYFRRFTLFADNAFLNSRQRHSLEVDVRSRRLENTTRAGIDVRLTPKASLEVNGVWGRTEFDADDSLLGGTLQQSLNRETTGFGIVGRYRLSVLTTFELAAERFEERFPLSFERNNDSVRIMPGVRFSPRALINGHARIGVRHLNPIVEQLLPEFKGLVSDFGLAYTAGGSTTFRLTYTREIQYSFELTQPYYVDTGVGVNVRRAIGHRFDVVGSVDRHRLAYEDLAVLQPFLDRRVDLVWNYTGSFGYRLGRDGRVGFGLSYWKRSSSTRASRNYDGLRIGTTATYGF